MNTKLWRLADVLEIFGICLFVTGAFPFINGNVEVLVGARPWVHRFCLNFAAISAFTLFNIHYASWKRGDAHEPLLAWITKKINFSPKLWVYILFLILGSVWTASSWIRHFAFQSSFDMAIFAQAFWNTLHGRFFYSSIKGGICLLGDHFSPLMILLLPPYAIWPVPEMLLLMQALGAASCVLPIYYIASGTSNDWKRGILFSFLFALYLPSANAVRFDFHPEILAMPFFLWGLHFLNQNNFRRASLFVLLGLLSKENAALSVFAIGLYAVTQNKKNWGLSWMIFSTVYFFVVIHMIIPAISKSPYFYLSGNFLAWKESGMGGLIQQVISTATASYLIKIFASTGFLSFLNPLSLMLCVPAILQNITARNEAVRSIFFQYTAFLTPFVFYSAMRGSARIHSFRKLAVLTLVPGLLFSGVSELYVIRRALRETKKSFSAMRAAFKRIPAQRSVRTHEFFAPHVADRIHLYIYENHNPKEGASPEALAADFVAIDRMYLGDRFEEACAGLLKQGYKQAVSMEGFRIFKK